MVDVDRWDQVREFVARLALPIGPAAGTPAWCELDDTDPAKLAALLRDGCRYVLLSELDRLDSIRRLNQASKSVATGTNWAATAQRVRRHSDARRSGTYIERKDHSA